MRRDTAAFSACTSTTASSSTSFSWYSTHTHALVHLQHHWHTHVISQNNLMCPSDALTTSPIPRPASAAADAFLPSSLPPKRPDVFERVGLRAPGQVPQSPFRRPLEEQLRRVVRPEPYDATVDGGHRQTDWDSCRGALDGGEAQTRGSLCEDIGTIGGMWWLLGRLGCSREARM
ncbi:hypothetical protein EDB87DRAFT_1619424 [Lactarius vividus]|nr:hypothetical protein EDB87DRAFT_1619424 [Lactarius vividus]